MKKLVLLISVLSLIGCSKDDLVEKEIVVNPKIVYGQIAGENYTLPDPWEIELVGNTLNKVKINNSDVDSFSYSGGRLVAINHFKSGVSIGVSKFNYNSDGTVISMKEYNASGIPTLYKTYNYPNSSIIEEVVNIYNAIGVVESTFTINKKIVNGNLVEYTWGDYQYDTYSYDNKQNVFSNLQCLNEIVLYYSNEKVGRNNRLLTNSVFKYNGSVLNTTSINYINDYDNSNRIIKSVVRAQNDNYLVKYTY